MNNNGQLHVYFRKDLIGLDVVIQDVKSIIKHGYAFLMSPERFEFTSLKNVNVNERIYEARIFGEGIDAVWIYGTGVSIKSEKGLNLINYEHKTIEFLDVSEVEYMMWGKVDEKGYLNEYQIKPVDIKGVGDFKEGSRPGLKIKEYLGVVDRYGNVGKVGEIIKDFVVIGGKNE